MNERPISYRSSGGKSQLRPYGNGEELRVELHKRSFSVLWTAQERSAADFMHKIAELVAAPAIGKAALAPSDDEKKYDFFAAQAGLEQGSMSADFIHVTFPDGEFTWQAPASSVSAKRKSVARSEIGVIWKRRNQFRSDWLRRLIGETATPHIVADVENIVESTEQLTSAFKPVAS